MFGGCLPVIAQVAQQHGHQVAMGSIWSWPALNWLPWANAMYIWLRAYTGGIIMLQDRWVGAGAWWRMGA